MAAISNFTGVEVSTLVLRLLPIELFFVSVLCLFLAGRFFSRSRWGGASLVTLTFFFGSLTHFVQSRVSLQPYRVGSDLFSNQMILHPYLSPSYLFGLPLFTLLAVLIGAEASREVRDWRVRMRPLAVILLLLIPLAYAKATTLPVMILGLGGAFVLDSLLRKRANLVFAFLCAVCGALYLLIETPVRGYYDVPGYIKLAPMDFYKKTQMFKQKLLIDAFGFWGTKVPRWGFYAIMIFGYAPVTSFGSLLWLKDKVREKWARKARKLSDLLSVQEVWLLCLAGLTWIMILLINHGPGQWYFLAYAVIPFGILATMGLVPLLNSLKRPNLRNAIATGILLVLTCAALMSTRHQMRHPTMTVDTLKNRYGGFPLIEPVLLEGLRWMRSHLKPNVIVAVNFNDYDAPDRTRYWYYSSFSERRFFMEGTYNTVGQVLRDHGVIKTKDSPYQDRHELLKRVFEQGDSEALDVMKKDFHVTHLLLDRHWRDLKLFAPDRLKLKAIYTSDRIALYEIP